MSKVRNRWVQKLVIFITFLGLTLVTIYLLNALSKTTKFQVFGELVNHVDTKEKDRATVRLVLSKGHELGNHSYSHQKMTSENPSFIRSEIEKTDQLLRQLGVKEEIHFRAPYGRKLLVLPYLLAKMNKKNILWNVNPNDYKAPNSEVIENYVLEHVTPGSIILLHDGGGDRSRTVTATESLIKKLGEKGYTFKTVSELMRVNAPRS
jgi:peptidoglycan/xylan/chitin deacetylase (PgdA/CDA1 family)